MWQQTGRKINYSTILTNFKRKKIGRDMLISLSQFKSESTKQEEHRNLMWLFVKLFDLNPCSYDKYTQTVILFLHFYFNLFAFQNCISIFQQMSKATKREK